jgi:hypothetical protein
MAEEQPNESMSSADTLAHFQYRPFQHSDEIRVLQIIPASDEIVFICKLDFVCLGEDPKYAVLSYTWGDADAKYAAVDRRRRQKRHRMRWKLVYGNEQPP